MKSQGDLAVDADWEGYSHWVDRTSGQLVVDPPYPVPADWLERFAWRISRTEVESLAAQTQETPAFLFGSVENEVEVWDLFNLVICLVLDNETLRESTYLRLGATLVDGTQRPSAVADATRAAAIKTAPI